MKKITPISGFPEWLPEQRLVEQEFLDRIRRKFELFGFAPIETRSVEPLEQLLQKGETDKEIYVLKRLQALDDGEDAELGLHFDLTVPFARYVCQFEHHLQFPWKRYQIQKSWRGERPQEGRYREFYQADIDVIGDNELPIFFDAEMPRLLYDVLSSLPIPPVTVSINNRKALEGFYRALGVPAEGIPEVLRSVDKLDKVGEEGVAKLLVERAGLTISQADRCLELARVRGVDVVEKVSRLGVSGELLQTGLDELSYVLDSLKDLPAGAVTADLRIARGLDYYTGTVYETIMTGHEPLGSICSGGRYDNLAAIGTSRRFPGVGVSIGVSRLLGYLFSRQMLRGSRATPSCVLVALPSDTARGECAEVARQLRSREIACEVFHKPIKYGKQIRFAERKGIPYVWFPQADEGGQQVRDIRSGKQETANPATWTPPDEDLRVGILLSEPLGG